MPDAFYVSAATPNSTEHHGVAAGNAAALPSHEETSQESSEDSSQESSEESSQESLDESSQESSEESSQESSDESSRESSEESSQESSDESSRESSEESSQESSDESSEKSSQEEKRLEEIRVQFNGPEENSMPLPQLHIAVEEDGLFGQDELCTLNETGLATFVVPEAGQRFRLRISQLGEARKPEDASWQPEGHQYSRVFTLEELTEQDGLVIINLAPVEKKENPHTLTIEITGENAGGQAILGRGPKAPFSLDDWFVNGKLDLDGLTVEVLDEGGNSLGSGVTVKTDETTGSATITLNSPLEDAKLYKVLLTGMKSTVEIVGWQEEASGFSKEFQGAVLNSGRLGGIVMRNRTQEMKRINMSAWDQHDDLIPVNMTLELHEYGSDNLVDSFQSTAATPQEGFDWRVSDQYYYILKLNSADPQIFLDPSSLSSIGTFDTTEYLGAVKLADESYEYSWKIDFNSGSDNEAIFTTYFMDTRAKLIVDKDHPEEYAAKGKDIYIGVADMKDQDTILEWKVIPGGKGSVSFDVTNAEMHHVSDPPGTPLRPTVVEGFRDYAIYEYVPESAQPDQAEWRWMGRVDPIKYGLPNVTEPYSLYIKDSPVGIRYTVSEETLQVYNTDAQLSFDLAGGANFAVRYDLEAVAAPYAEWTVDKTAEAGKTLTNRGDPFTIDYQVEFRRTLDESGKDTNRLVFKDIELTFVYDQRAIKGNNQVGGVMTLYKKGPGDQYTALDSVSFNRLLSNGSPNSTSGNEYKMTLLMDLVDKDYSVGDVYQIRFEGGYYYAPDGNPDLSAPYQRTNRKTVDIPVSKNPVPPSSSGTQDRYLKEFTDLFTNIGTNYKLDRISDVTVNGALYNANRVVLTPEAGPNYTGFKLVPPNFVSGEPEVITVTYKAHFTDLTDSPNVEPCLDKYKVTNRAGAVKNDSKTAISDTAETTVTIPTYVSFDVEKLKRVSDPTGSKLEPERGIVFALYHSGQKLGSGTTDATGKARIVDSQGKDVRVPNPKAEDAFVLEVTVPDNNFPPHTEDIQWEHVSGKVWRYPFTLGEVNKLPGNGDTACGYKAITAVDKSGFRVFKTGQAVGSSRFYLFRGNTLVKQFTGTEAKNGVFVDREGGATYSLYEVTSKGVTPKGDWVAADTYPNQIQPGANETVYRYTGDLSGRGTDLTIENLAAQKLLIKKALTGDKAHANTDVFRFQVTAAGETSPLRFVAKAGTSHTYQPAAGQQGDDTLTLTAKEVLEGKFLTIEGLAPGGFTVKEILPTHGGVPLYTLEGGQIQRSITIGMVDGGAPETVTVSYTNTARLQNGSLIVSKQLVGPNGNEDFTFVVYRDGSKVKLSDEMISFTGSGALLEQSGDTLGKFTLKGGGTATLKNLPLGTKYKIEESTPTGFATTYTVDGGPVQKGSVTGELLVEGNEDIAVAFTNARQESGVLQVKKSLPANTYLTGDEVFVLKVEGKFLKGNGAPPEATQQGYKLIYFTTDGRVVTDGFGTGYLDLINGGLIGGVCSVPGVVGGFSYQASELEHLPTATRTEDYAVEYTPQGGRAKAPYAGEATVIVTVGNTRKATGQITIEKQMIGSREHDVKFPVYLKESGGAYLKLSGLQYSGVTASRQDATPLMVSMNSSVTVTGLPLGMVITAEEVLPSDSPYMLDISFGTNGYINNEAQVTAESQSITVGNKPKSSLSMKLVKKMSREDLLLAGDDTFEITVREESGSGRVVYQEVFGVAEHLMDFNREYAVENLTPGMTYVVSERFVGSRGHYTTTAIGLTRLSADNRQGEITLKAGSDKTVGFENKRITEGGKLYLIKQLADAGKEQGNELFVATVKGTFLDGATQKNVFFRQNEYTLTQADRDALAALDPNAIEGVWGQPVQVPGVVPGFPYQIEESQVLNGKMEHYAAPAISQTEVIIALKEDASVYIKNRRLTGRVEVTKVVEGQWEQGDTFTLELRRQGHTDRHDITLTKGAPTAIVEDLPLGATYILEEKLTGAKYLLVGYQSEGNPPQTEPLEIVVGEDPAKVTVTNLQDTEGRIYLRKSTSGTVRDEDKFHLVVTGLFQDENGTVEQTRRDYVFSAKPGIGEHPLNQAIPLPGAILGETYQVYELASPGNGIDTALGANDLLYDRYTVDYPGKTATADKADASVTNTLEVRNTADIGNLHIRKAVWGGEAGGQFQLLLQSGEKYLEFEQDGDGYRYVGLTDQRKTIVIQEGRTVSASGIPMGLPITLDEVDPGQHTPAYFVDGAETASFRMNRAEHTILVTNEAATRLTIVKRVQEGNGAVSGGSYGFRVLRDGQPVPVARHGNDYIYQPQGPDTRVQVDTAATNDSGYVGTGSALVLGLPYGSYTVEELTDELTDDYYLESMDGAAFRFWHDNQPGGKSAHTVTAINARRATPAPPPPPTPTPPDNGNTPPNRNYRDTDTGGRDIPDGDIPRGQASATTENTITIPDAEVPLAGVSPGEIPDAGGTPVALLTGAGGLMLIALGLILHARKKRKGKEKNKDD